MGEEMRVDRSVFLERVIPGHEGLHSSLVGGVLGELDKV